MPERPPRAISIAATTPVTRPVFNAVAQCTALSTLPRLPGMHIMQALVGCQKRSTKILARSLHPIDGMGGMRGGMGEQRRADEAGEEHEQQQRTAGHRDAGHRAERNHLIVVEA